LRNEFRDFSLPSIHAGDAQRILECPLRIDDTEDGGVSIRPTGHIVDVGAYPALDVSVCHADHCCRRVLWRETAEFFFLDLSPRSAVPIREKHHNIDAFHRELFAYHRYFEAAP